MGRPRNPNRDKAFELYSTSGGKLTPQEIANQIGESLQLIRNWKNQDKWDIELGIITTKGAKKGNKNAIGNNGGAPEGNQNNRKYGFYSKYLPKKVFNAFEDVENMSNLDILWTNIQIKQANILHAQKIMHVKSSKDHTKEVKKVKSSMAGDETEWELQFAWDKQANFLKAESIAMRDLSKMVKEYEELLHKNWDLATEEQRTRIEVLKSKIPSEDETQENKLDKYFDMLEKSFKND